VTLCSVLCVVREGLQANNFIFLFVYLLLNLLNVHRFPPPSFFTLQLNPVTNVLANLI